MKTWAILVLFTLNLLSINAKAQDEPEKSTLVKVGQDAPDFSFTDESGVSHKLDELKGKVVLLNFFATWCGPCMKEMPHVQKEIFDKYGKNDNFILLSIGREHSPQEMKDFKEKKAFTFNIIADQNREIYSKFALQYIPRNILIDKDGKILYSSIGFDEEEFAQLVNKIEAQLN
ncbi:TlpA family protein disulfide reductase [Mangrovibacterium diazotrophicum]|uniref:Peroxiredoxin n=1 Tax=Mangrovibacterium diazotrophicum TaxID=1261403 RepID=A0A419VXH3_9BACT|nr:TlpA disulfide reductase family protein [Mangrovibacterium diazotrophicum]RKD87923.1 peroxiredoxin [Mangrovibacterium diazotrophicum]